MKQFPKQKLTNAERQNYPLSVESRDWYEQCADHFTDQIIDGDCGDKDEVLMTLRACEGNIDQDTYKYVLNPFNIKGKSKLTKYPARLRNYDILSIVFETAAGEKADEPDTAQVVATNTYADEIYVQQHNKEMEDLLVQDFINVLNKAGLDTGMINKAVEDYKKKNDMFYANLTEKKAIDGQDKLDLIRAENRTKNILQNMFDRWTKVKQCYSYKDVDGEKLIYEDVPVHQLYAFLSSNSVFVEDGHAAVRHQCLSINEIVDRYYEDLMELKTDDYDPIDAMESYLLTGARVGHKREYITTDVGFPDHSDRFNWPRDNDGKFDVYHSVWQGFRMLKEVTFWNPMTGQVDYKCCDEDYVLDKEAGDIEEKIVWVNRIYEVTTIEFGGRDRMYLRKRPLPIQRNEISNKSVGKLPYNGIVKLTEDKRVYSWGSRGLVYQVIINIMRYQMEKMINKHKDKILLMPKGFIPSEEGWDEDNFIYYSDALGFAFVDETNPNFAAGASAIKVLDMSLGKYIQEIYNITTELKMEFYASIGFNPQRLGNIKTTAGKATTDNAIMQSFISSKELFRQFNEFVETEYNGLLDYSKVAWVDGKRGTIVNPTGQIYQVDIDGFMHANTQFGVFVRDTNKENDNLKLMKQFGFNMSQNGEDPEMVGEIVNSNNMPKVMAALKKFSAAKREFQAAMEKQKNDAMLQAKKMETDAKQAENDQKVMLQNMEDKKDVLVAQIAAGAKNNGGGVDDTSNDLDAIIEGTANNLQQFNQSNQNELNAMKTQQSNDQKYDMDNKKLKQRKDEMESKEKIAKENKN